MSLRVFFIAAIALGVTGCGGNGAGGVVPAHSLAYRTDDTAEKATPRPIDWDSFGYDLQRTGYNPKETVVGPSNVALLARLWTTNVGAHVMREAVLAANVSVAGVATNVLYAGSNTGATLYAINAKTGATIWKDAVVPREFTCNNAKSQFSIVATPAIDRTHQRIYFTDGDNNVHAVNLATGKSIKGWPISVATYLNNNDDMHGGLTYNSANGMLYAVTGSHCDLTPWHGRIVAIDVSTAKIVGTFYPVSGTATAGGGGGGIWAAGGASIDPTTNDVLVATGNADTTTGIAQNAGYAENVVVLTPNLGTVVAANYPANIPTMGGALDDLDFGSTPVIFTPPGCPELVAAQNKSGMFELYDESTIASGPVQYIEMSIDTDQGDFQGSPAYDPVTNMVYVGLPATESPYSPGLAAFSVQSNCTLAPTPVWSAAFGPDGATTTADTARSPITIANGVVYVSNRTGNTEFAFDAVTGAQLWTVGLTNNGLSGTLVANGIVYVTSDDGTITAWAPPAATVRNY